MPPDSRSWVAVPAPVRDLFKLFPLRVYAAEELPSRAPHPTRPRPSLYVFALDGDCARPSFNPSCLKWQTFLRIAGVDVDLIPSNNHASPSGALPFLLPSSTNSRSSPPLTGGKIEKYAQENATRKIPTIESNRLEAYRSLITQSIRPAWLYSLYIDPSNASLLKKLYIPPSPLLAYSLHHTLVTAATTEILKGTRTPYVRTAQLYADSATAFAALETLLGNDAWFFGASSPGLFDAEVFSYTWLILDESLAWEDGGELQKSLAGFKTLVAHRQRLYDWCW
ncbi:unnamed protein product [Clonostachys rosea]|uniref:Thioredoxin-like fold domain-containing protein n=1 Tax=Bionectria ochroleuca TaxID=29856 RepID=A0ABY6V4A8_BIOOC|nr:unnamed protein product [Clonostachys rosea]